MTCFQFLLAVIITSFLSQPINGEFRLTVVHTNDVHARFDQVSKYGGPCRHNDVIAGQCFGGVARRMTALRHIRNTTDHVLLLDAGDQFQGTLWFFVHQGGATGHFMNRLGYDAMALGNHELDNGVSGLLPFLDQIDFPVLCSNINTSQEPEVAKRIRSSFVFRIQGQKVGIIGYITKDTKELSDSGKLIFLDEIQSVREQVQLLRSSGVNIIIALGHAGYDLDLKLASEVEGLDVIIGGHTDTFLYTGEPPSIEKPVDNYPKLVRQHSGHEVLVIHNYAFGKYLGRLDLTFDDGGEVLQYHGNPILLDNNIEEDPDILKEMDVWREPVLAVKDEVVGSTEVFLDGEKASCRLYECTMGNLLASAMLFSYTKGHSGQKAAHAAIINSGSVRASLEIGNISLADLQIVQPFRNTLDVIDIRGRYIKQILEHSVKGYDVTRKHGKFLQVAGLKVLYDLSRPDGKRVKDVCIQREAGSGKFERLSYDKIYRLVVTTFLIKGGDGYTMIKKHALKIDISESLDLEVTMDYLKSHSPVVVHREGRIIFVDEKDEFKWRCQPLSLGVMYSAGANLLSEMISLSIISLLSSCLLLYT